MHVKRYFLTFGVPLVFILSVAMLVHVLIEGEQGTTGGLHPADAVILFLTLCGLILIFLLAHVLTGNSVLGLTISDRVRSVMTLCALLLLPQSTILYGRIAEAVQSEMTLFAVYNMIDIAVGRLLLALLRKRIPLLPAPREKPGEDRG